ncbi:CD209 antigen-like protein C [Garra rufa]|uniref:CD209 antigen-like protein C n=1 Tax=Garra rufa TaxID=137080 RepID=UPI003CCE644A
MSDDIYNNVIRTVSEEMSKDRVEMTVDIYESADYVRDLDFRTETNTHQPHQPTGSDSVKSRCSRAAVVCLVLLCALLLATVIVLCVHIHTNNTNYTKERDGLLTNITNLREERNELIIKNKNISNKTQLLNQLELLYKWIYYQSSFYYMSTEKKNWTESRQDCLKRRADLIIINNSEEQEFVKKITEKREFWIGLTDTAEEGTWKWVNGSTLTSGIWAPGEPNGKTEENCAVTSLERHPELIGWFDIKCDGAHQWICEKNIWP